MELNDSLNYILSNQAPDKRLVKKFIVLRI